MTKERARSAGPTSETVRSRSPPVGRTLVPVQTPGHESRAFDEVIERLVDQFPDVPADSVRAIVNAAWEEFSDSRIRDFVPVLAERNARQQLRDNVSG